jgi:TRAP-type C4-dicarboxylate transport system substrate-binding protein
VAPNVLDLGWAPIVGAVVIREDAWNKVPSDLQSKLLELGEKTGTALRKDGREFYDQTMATLRRDPKVKVRTLTSEERALWEAFGRELGPQIRGNLVPAGVYDQVQQLLEECRAARGGTPGKR